MYGFNEPVDNLTVDELLRYEATCRQLDITRTEASKAEDKTRLLTEVCVCLAEQQLEREQLRHQALVDLLPHAGEGLCGHEVDDVDPSRCAAAFSAGSAAVEQDLEGSGPVRHPAAQGE